MDIYITEIDSGVSIGFSMLPETINCKCAADFQSYSIINGGEVKIPKGSKLTGFSWSGTLPGESRRELSFLKKEHWREPSEIQSQWSLWRERGIKLKLMVTETPVNHDVYLDDYSINYTGGNGDFEYNISFVSAKSIEIYTVSELNISPIAQVNNQVESRPAAPTPNTYTVKKGDCLWTIAQRYLGKGSRWGEIYDLNKGIIKNPNLIYPGQVLTLPS